MKEYASDLNWEQVNTIHCKGFERLFFRFVIWLNKVLIKQQNKKNTVILLLLLRPSSSLLFLCCLLCVCKSLSISLFFVLFFASAVFASSRVIAGSRPAFAFSIHKLEGQKSTALAHTGPLLLLELVEVALVLLSPRLQSKTLSVFIVSKRGFYANDAFLVPDRRKRNLLWLRTFR